MGSWVPMRNNKDQAIKLRLQGNSYSEIGKELNISKSTLSNWLSDIKLPIQIDNAIKLKGKEKSISALVKRNKDQTRIAIIRSELIKNKSEQDILDINNKSLLLIGATLYWGEGYKKAIIRDGKEKIYHMVSFSNTDPEMIKIFIKFLKIICKISDERIKANLHIFEHQDENNIVDYWKNITGIRKENFGKTYFGASISSKRLKPFNQQPYGTIQIRVCDTELFYKIMGWIEGIKKKQYNIDV